MWGIGNKKTAKNSPRMETSGDKSKSKKRKETKPSNKQKEYKVMRKIASILDGSILTSDWAIEKIPFFFFLFLLALIYIGNNYIAQAKVKKIDSINKELKDLRDEHISVKSDLMYFTKRSELAKRLKDRGVKEATNPPFKIYVLKKKGE